MRRATETRKKIFIYILQNDEQQQQHEDVRKERTFFSIYLLEYGITNKIHSWSA